MIKRNGIELMNARSNNVSIGKETMQITAQKQYTAPNGQTVEISQAVDNCVKKTVLYKVEDPSNMDWEPYTPTIEVINETTAQAAARLLQDGKQNIVALNFAAACHPGGGFLSGAIAQEEDLCRASALYACLNSKPIFYNENIICDNAFYTDNVIYSPNVPFFRAPDNSLLEQPFVLSIVSSPAPNVRNMSESDLKEKDFDLRLHSTFLDRMVRILNVCAIHGHRNIILGAWGCGAYSNDPVMVASAFKEALNKVPAFEHICFAVYDNRQPPILYETFKQTFLEILGTSIS